MFKRLHVFKIYSSMLGLFYLLNHYLQFCHLYPMIKISTLLKLVIICIRLVLNQFDQLLLSSNYNQKGWPATRAFFQLLQHFFVYLITDLVFPLNWLSWSVQSQSCDVRVSVCLCNVLSSCGFLGLSLALISHDQLTGLSLVNPLSLSLFQCFFHIFHGSSMFSWFFTSFHGSQFFTVFHLFTFLNLF